MIAVSYGIGIVNPLLAQQPSSDSKRDSVLSLPPEQREHLQRTPYVYERYHTPEQCANAAWRALYRYRRDLRMDTVFLRTTRDTLPAVVKEVAASCFKQFDVTTIPVTLTPGAFRAALFSGEADKREVAYERFIHEYPANDTAQMRHKSNLMSRLVRQGWWYQDAPLEKIFELGKIVEEMGPGTARFAISIYESAFSRAEDSLDPDLGIKAAQKSRDAWLRMKNPEIADWGGFRSNFDRWQMYEFWKNGIQASYDLVRKDFVPTVSRRIGGGEDSRTYAQQMLERGQQMYQYLGDTAPPILARYWFDSNGVAERLPKSGRTTVVFFLEPRCGQSCYGTYAMIRRAHALYSQKGLDILVVSKLSGHFRLHIPKNNAEELELIRNYYLDFLKLPVTLAVDEVRFSRRADGFRTAEEIAWRRNWPTDMNAIIARDGTFVGFDMTKNEWQRAFYMMERAADGKSIQAE